MGHSNKCSSSSLNTSQNSLKAIRIKLLPRRVGVLAFLPLESRSGTLSNRLCELLYIPDEEHYTNEEHW